MRVGAMTPRRAGTPDGKLQGCHRRVVEEYTLNRQTETSTGEMFFTPTRKYPFLLNAMLTFR